MAKSNFVIVFPLLSTQYFSKISTFQDTGFGHMYSEIKCPDSVKLHFEKFRTITCYILEDYFRLLDYALHKIKIYNP